MSVRPIPILISGSSTVAGKKRLGWRRVSTSAVRWQAGRYGKGFHWFSQTKWTMEED